jgi:ankyrin repeat protein
LPDRHQLLAAMTALCLVGAGAEARAPAGQSDALVRAVSDSDLADVLSALANHADANVRLDFGATPLGWAVNSQSPDIVAALLAHGARPDLADSDGTTPLALACELGNAAIIDALLDAHANPQTVSSDGMTVLAICARFGPANAVRRLLSAGAPADAVDSRGQTPLMWAASSGHIEAMAMLLGAGADANRVSAGAFTPLFFAIKSGVPGATEALLAAGAKADHLGPEGTSAVQLAVYQRNFAAAALLIARGGTDLTARDRNGEQLLHAAAASGDAALIGLLLAKGADPNGFTGPSRITWVTEANFGVAPAVAPPTPPLLIAAAAGKEPAMRMLLKAGANSHFVAADGTNIVLAAAKGGSAAALALALQYEPNANVANADGVTALHILAGGMAIPDLEPMMRLLSAHGARTDLKTNKGKTAAQYAEDGLTAVRTAFRLTFPNADRSPPAQHIAARN